MLKEKENQLEREEELEERYQLAVGRIQELIQEQELENPEIRQYFRIQFSFAVFLTEVSAFFESGRAKEAPLEELELLNSRLYEDILPEHYESSYANPEYAFEKTGRIGKYLCCAAAEMRAMIPAAAECRKEGMVIRLELMLELYGCFLQAQNDCMEEPEEKAVKEILYWYFHDYSEPEMIRRVAGQVSPENNYAAQYLADADPADLRFLYMTGEYVSKQEKEAAAYMAGLKQEKIDLIASAWTEGFRVGFELTGKDLSRKKTVEIRYHLGFERIAARAAQYFAGMGLRTAVRRTPVSLLENKVFQRSGFTGAVPNPQFDYDHREDLGLFLDGNMVQRKLEVLEEALEMEKENAAVYAGPACLETFGEPDFTPGDRAHAVRYSDAQQKEMVRYAAASGEITNRYIRGEERSYTIIAFPLPGIGPDYESVFEETVRINTLDYRKYSHIQQKMTDALDRAEYVLVKGRGKNRTNMKVCLHTLTDRDHQTNFENCAADVNIPVGEVFTSPRLAGTEGTLHVSGVFLNGLFYRDLEFTFHDGRAVSWNCLNYPEEEKNRKLIEDTILFHHETLPIGEFAIGTNTTAFVAAGKLGIMDKLPILIAEKTGPHFALGDTCYSHEEDVRSFNPDGKEIVAKENEVSALRVQNPEKAYFNCHTDITIPYDEIGEISAVHHDNTVEMIMEDGRFVLDGCGELNEPFGEL